MHHDKLPWYCNTNRDHEHKSMWEADNCTELYERWAEAMAHLLAYVREDEVALQVNTILPDDLDGEGG